VHWPDLGYAAAYADSYQVFRRLQDDGTTSPAGSREWGICTECGMGRVQPGDVPTLLNLHRTILDTHGGNR